MHDEFRCSGIYREGRIELDGPAGLPDGTRVHVLASTDKPPLHPLTRGPVIVAGFGLSGRAVADLFASNGYSRHECVVVDRNAATIATQSALGRRMIEGDISDESTLVAAGIREASLLALTIPDEDAVLRAVELARRLNPDVYIIARTTYASRGIRAIELGANDVVKSEQAVALQFHERLRRRFAPCDTPRE